MYPTCANLAMFPFLTSKQCKHPYAAHWHHTKKHCPNLVPNADDMEIFPFQTPTVPVSVHFKPPASFDSLAHLWSEWYRQYYDADYPRLMGKYLIE